jgi:hypothetical protein
MGARGAQMFMRHTTGTGGAGTMRSPEDLPCAA